MASRQDWLDDKETGPELLSQTCVDVSIVWVDAIAQQGHVVIATPASNANNLVMGKRAALSKSEATYGMHPKYLWYNVWCEQYAEGKDVQVESLQCLTDWTEHAKPLPSVPLSKLHNSVALDTIHGHPDLFKVVMPINVDHFEVLLASHPN